MSPVHSRRDRGRALDNEHSKPSGWVVPEKTAIDHLVIGGVPTPKVTLPPLPQINPGQVLGGCGRGRIRDPQTNSCRGPGNIGR